jgi:hypothetical protein
MGLWMPETARYRIAADWPRKQPFSFAFITFRQREGLVLAAVHMRYGGVYKPALADTERGCLAMLNGDGGCRQALAFW